MSGNVLEQFGYQSGSNAIYTFDSTDLIYTIRTNTNLVPSRDDWWYGINSVSYEVGASTVPEPSSLALLGLGSLGMACGARRRRRRSSSQLAGRSTR